MNVDVTQTIGNLTQTQLLNTTASPIQTKKTQDGFAGTQHDNIQLNQCNHQTNTRHQYTQSMRNVKERRKTQLPAQLDKTNGISKIQHPYSLNTPNNTDRTTQPNESKPHSQTQFYPTIEIQKQKTWNHTQHAIM